MNPSSPWARGYPVSEPYPPSWHPFLSPAHLRVVCALMGVAWDVGPEMPMSIAEVGCGTGYSAAVLAAGNPRASVLGLDYNAAHIAEARSLAGAAGLQNLRYEEVDLAELSDTELDRYPEFDLVTVHGVWSWVDDPVREGVLRLLRRRLKTGGVAMISYNTLPGAAGSLGLARLVRSTLQATGGDTGRGVAAVRQVVQRLIAAEAVHLPPSGWRRLFTDESATARPGYVLHEFLTAHWRPSFFADVATSMASARCEYVGSATLDENFPHMTLSPAQRELWDEAPDDAARELIKDLCVPRAFRRDVYVRGLRRVPRDPAVDALWLVSARQAVGPASLSAQAGLAELPQPLVDAVRSALMRGPQTVGALRALPGCGDPTPSELVAFLLGSGSAVPLWCAPDRDACPSDAFATARRFNQVTAERLVPCGVGAGQFGLSSPALGGALPATALELAAVKQITEAGVATPAAADLVRRLLPPGVAPEPEIVAELERSVALMLREKLPVWRALEIV